MTYDIPELFGSLVFGDAEMKARVDEKTYKALKKCTEQGDSLAPEIASEVATAMKEWAIDNGATHYTHWFQPMTGVTAEKHDSFITPSSDGKIIMNFSGKELIKSEADASSFPSGGLRSTFEARGYTAWDPTSYAFIKDGVLCIPTAFISYSGQVLDKKTPLLRSMRALEIQAKRVLKFFGKNAGRIDTTVGAEQEYFLIDKDLWLSRRDLQLTGRTLFGAKPPKGQEMDDHYFGTIRPRVIAYMQELDLELWKLGVLAKTRHNEAAPAQHELAPVFTSVNVASDQNQLTMEVMQKVADRHNLVCLLHEKPFKNVSGSGKHNNWSISADGENLLEPGKNPETNDLFLTFLTAFIKAVDENQDLLRLSVASASNDHRLGASEAPPAIISMFLGDELLNILECISKGKTYNKKACEKLKLSDNLPEFMLDTTDRNRTSPLAFTGNKFEFRMLGSSFNIACTNVMLNTAVADALKYFADELDKGIELKKLITKVYKKHKRIIFNGNNYSTEWFSEAEKRGLINLDTTPKALATYDDAKNVQLFARHGIYTREELTARKEILLAGYSKIINIEARTMLEMARRQIIPSCEEYSLVLCKIAESKQRLNVNNKTEKDLLEKISGLIEKASDATQNLRTLRHHAKTITNTTERATYYCDVILPAMETLRTPCDELERVIPDSYWAFPIYADLLFSV